MGLSDYKKWTKYFEARDVDIQNQVPIVQRAYARVGLIGNPSDGFHGKTIALSIKNFWAEATIFESPRLNLIPHPLNDPTSFGNLADLHVISKKEGYMGGLRLVQATCKKFYEFCDVNGIALPRRNFTLRFLCSLRNIQLRNLFLVTIQISRVRLALRAVARLLLRL